MRIKQEGTVQRLPATKADDASPLKTAAGQLTTAEPLPLRASSEGPIVTVEDATFAAGRKLPADPFGPRPSTGDLFGSSSEAKQMRAHRLLENMREYLTAVKKAIGDGKG